MFTEGTYSVIKQGTLPRGNTSASISFNVPETSYGNYFVEFFQPMRDAINAEFNIVPHIAVSPATTTPGSTVLIEGTGFGSSDLVTLELGDGLASLESSANDLGSFSVNMQIPDLVTGNHEITVSSRKIGYDITSAGIQITTGGSGIEVIDPLPDQPDNQGQNNNSTPDNSTPPVTTPAVPQQTQTMWLSKPVIVSPVEESIGLLGKQPVTFKWGAGDDSVGVSYNIEISKDFGFNSALTELKKTGINSKFFTAEISPGTYYWRVKAIDGQGHESDWAYSPYPFKVGDFPLLPVVIGLIIAACLVVIVRALFRMNHRRDDYFY